MKTTLQRNPRGFEGGKIWDWFALGCVFLHRDLIEPAQEAFAKILENQPPVPRIEALDEFLKDQSLEDEAKENLYKNAVELMDQADIPQNDRKEIDYESFYNTTENKWNDILGHRVYLFPDTDEEYDPELFKIDAASTDLIMVTPLLASGDDKEVVYIPSCSSALTAKNCLFLKSSMVGYLKSQRTCPANPAVSLRRETPIWIFDRSVKTLNITPSNGSNISLLMTERMPQQFQVSRRELERWQHEESLRVLQELRALEREWRQGLRFRIQRPLIRRDRSQQRQPNIPRWYISNTSRSEVEHLGEQMIQTQIRRRVSERQQINRRRRNAEMQHYHRQDAARGFN